MENEFNIRLLTTKDISLVSEQYVSEFMEDESTFRILGHCDQVSKEMCGFVTNLIHQNLSHGAFHKTTGKLASYVITCCHHKERDSPQPKPMSHEVRELFRLSTLLEESGGGSLFQKFDSYAEIYTVSTAREFRGHGLLKKAMAINLSYLRENGYSLVEGLFSSPYSRAAAYSLGFKELSRVSYKELRNSDGHAVDPLTQEFASLMTLLEK